MNIEETAKEIHEINKNKGFWDEKRNVGEMLMLVVSELAEALEADRIGDYVGLSKIESRGVPHNAQDTRDYVRETGFNSSGNPTFPHRFETKIKNTFEDEIADSVIRLFDIAEGLGINLEWHIRAKIDYNKTRPHKHGKKY